MKRGILKAIWFVILMFSLVSVMAGNIDSTSLYCEALQKKLTLINTANSFRISSAEIVLESGMHTNLFYSPDGWVKENNAPRLMFNADHNFIFRAKINCPLTSKWDGAVLLLEYDQYHWAKLCFEKDYMGNARIVSVVNDTFSDDCNSNFIQGNMVYLEIARKENVVYFYYSTDNKEYYLVRNFKFPYANTSLGFLVQSPAGSGNISRFTDISYKKTELKDFWKGE